MRKEGYRKVKAYKMGRKELVGKDGKWGGVEKERIQLQLQLFGGGGGPYMGRKYTS